MRKHWTWVAWGLLALGCVGNAAGIALAVANGSFLQNPGDSLLWVVFGAFLVVGCLIVARRPSNRIGWIFTAVGLLTMIAGLAENYARYARAHPGSLPAPRVADWVLEWIWPPTIILTLAFPLLLFPTGRSLSPRWRPVTWLAVGLTAAPLSWAYSAPPASISTRPSRHDPERPAAVLAGRGGGLAGRPLPALPRGGTPAAEVVHLCRRAGAAGPAQQPLLSSDCHGEFVTEPVGVRLTVQQLGPLTTHWRWRNERASRWPGSRASRNVLPPDPPRDGSLVLGLTKGRLSRRWWLPVDAGWARI